MRYVINGSITTLWEVSEQVLDLTQDLQEFQVNSSYQMKHLISHDRVSEIKVPGFALMCVFVGNGLAEEQEWGEGHHSCENQSVPGNGAYRYFVSLRRVCFKEDQPCQSRVG
jgi:hypothetical protein